MKRLPRWQRNRPITAADLNTMAEAIEALMEIRGGRGVEVRVGPEGVQIALADALRDRWRLCRIEQVLDHAGAVVTGAALTQARLPSRTRYRVRDALSSAVHPSEAGAAAFVPVYGRDPRGDEGGIYAALPGDYCALWRNIRDGVPVAELDVWTEKTARVLC